MTRDDEQSRSDGQGGLPDDDQTVPIPVTPITPIAPVTPVTPPSRPAGAGRSRVIRPAGGRRGGPGRTVTGGAAGSSPSESPSSEPPSSAAPSSGSPSSDSPVPPTPPLPTSPPGDSPASTSSTTPASDPDTKADDTTDTKNTTDGTGTDGTPATPPAPPSARPSRGRVTGFSVLAAVLIGALGFALVVQARQTQGGDLSSLSQSELVRLLDDVSRQGERLDAVARDLEATQNELRSGTDRAAAAEKATRERLDVLGILAGTEPAQGPGITIAIQDPQALVDAATLLDTVQELRDAGAEAIEFGQVRVVASTSFTDPDTGGAVIADGVEQSPPYRLTAIGDPATMESALNIPGGVLETLHQVGASGTVQRRQDLTVTAVRQVSTPAYAVPRTAEPQD